MKKIYKNDKIKLPLKIAIFRGSLKCLIFMEEITEKPKSKSLTKNAILNMIKAVVSLIFPLITFPYASRVLGPDGLGKIHWAQSIVSYLGIVASLGITNYAAREASKLKEDKTELSKFAKEILIINLTSCLIAYILFFIAVFTIPHLKECSTILFILSSLVFFEQIGVSWLFTAEEEFTFTTIRFIAFYFISIILLFTTVKTENDLVQYAFLTVIASICGCISNFILSFKYVNPFIKTKIEIKKHLKPIFILFGMTAATSIYSILDTSMIGFISNDTQVGFYTAATKINRLVLSMVTAITTVMFPRLSVYAKEENKEKFYSLVYKGFDVLFLFALPCCFGLTAISGPLIYLFSGSEYLEAVPVMRIMNPVIIITGLSNFIGVQIFIPLNKEKWTLYSVLAGTAVNAILNSIFIRLFGAMGAAVSTVISELVIAAIQLIMSRKFIKHSVLLKRFLIYLLDSVIMIIPVCLCLYFIKNMVLTVIFGILAGVITYFLVLLIQKNEILMSFLQKFFAKIHLKK